MEFLSIVQDTVMKTISKKKYKEEKWLSELGLQTADEKREVNGKRERYTQMNEEFRK